MATNNSQLPRPRRRLLRTLLRRPRRLRKFAPRISFEDVAGQMPEAAEAAHWGEVILLEDMFVALHRDGTTSWLTHTITMPYGDQHLAEWDDVSRLYDRRKWRPFVGKAVVHLPDGGQRKAKRVVAPVNSYERTLQLTFSPLRPGVIVEFEEQQEHFKIDDVGPGMWAQFLLRGLCPCRRRRVTVAVARPFSAAIQPHHCPWQPQESQERGYHVYRWDVHDVEGIEADAWTPPPRDFASWIDVSTLPDWLPVVQHYSKELLPGKRASEPVKKLAQELVGRDAASRDKAMAVYRYATQDVRYGRHPSELNLHSIREQTKLLEDLRGDCKDKSSLMVSLLAELDVPAQVAVVLTAQNGRTAMLPSLRFDHAIVRAQVDGNTMWFDPAGGPYSFGELPQNDQGIKALILDGQQPQFVDVPEDPPEDQLVQRSCEGTLDDDGNYCFRASVTAVGERAAAYRMALLDRNEDHRRRTIQQSVAEERPGAEVDEIEIGDLADLDTSMSLRYRVALPKWARRVEDLFLLRIPWAEPIDFSGPVSAAERLQPLQMPAPHRQREEHVISIPGGFGGYGLPSEIRLECRWASYDQKITCEHGKLICHRQMDTCGGIIPPESFSEFRTFWEQAARADQADVVLIKRDEHP